MKILFKIGNLIFYAIVVFSLIVAVGSAVLKKPVLMSSVRSNSMYPLFQKGDMIFLSPFFKSKEAKVGDIVVFKTVGGTYDSKGLVVHRIIDGNLENGFITQGDANNYTDQSRDNPNIKAEWIEARVMAIRGKPLKLPLLGQLPLLMEKYSKKPYFFAVIVLIIGGAVAIGEFFGKAKKKVRRGSFDIQLIYFISGLTISILMFGSMLSKSQHLKLNYEVSESSNGVLAGSSIGVIKVGEAVTRPVTEFSSSGGIPMLAVIATKDDQITLSHTKLYLKKGIQARATMTINAVNPGKYDSSIDVGLFYPILPQSIIYSLANKSYWLALSVVSLMPGLPLMLYPLLNSRLRRKTILGLQRKLRYIKAKMSLT